MYPSVQSYFRIFSAPLEGCVPYMYLDVLGLVTVGVGNLVDPITLAQALPLRFKNRPGIAAPGSPATPDQIAAEWQTSQEQSGSSESTLPGFRSHHPIGIE